MSLKTKIFCKKNYLFCAIVGLIILTFILVANIVIETSSDGLIYRDINDVPAREVAVVLGTSRKIYGRPNLYFDTRISAAAELYHSGKVKRILVSGDNSQKYYDEPTDMKNDLIGLGVPEKVILVDNGGIRTLDSVVRASKVFLLHDFLIVSQEFQCERALFIAKHRNISAIAYTAQDVRHPGRFRIMFREFFARVKAGIDIWLINKQPKFPGKEVLVA